MKLFRIKFIIPFFLFIILTSCSTIRQLKKTSGYPDKYYAMLIPDFTKNNLFLHLITINDFSDGGHYVDMNHHNYGKYQTFLPIVRHSGGLAPQAFMPARGEIKLHKEDGIHLIFFFGESREEFLLRFNNDCIRVEEVTRSHYIKFIRNKLCLLPNWTLGLKIPSYKSIPFEFFKSLKRIGCIPLKLPLGHYSKFYIDDYENDYAHIAIPYKEPIYDMSEEEGKYYFFKINWNYAKIKETLLQFVKNYKNELGEISYFFNFDINQMIKAEKQDGILQANVSNSLRSISPKFERETNSINIELKKPGLIKILIYNILGVNIKKIQLKVDSPGTISYAWDGNIKEREKAKPGVYFYHIYLNGRKQITHRFILMK